MSETNEMDIIPVNQLCAENYICDICHELFENPKHTLCGHTFCDLCIKRELPIRPACPTCRRPISISDLLEASIILKKELAKIEVYCVNRCGWTGQKGDLGNHLANECDSQLRPCPNSKILDFPACQEQFLKSTMQSHLDKCLFKSLKPFVTALATSCSILAQQTDRSLKNMTEQCSTKVEKSEKSVKDLKILVEQCHLSSMQSSVSVSELKNVVDNCNRIIKESTKIRSSLPLPSTPTISGNQYIRISANTSNIHTTARVPGCTYREGLCIKMFAGMQKTFLEEDDVRECMAAMNIVARLGYSVADSNWYYNDERCRGDLLAITYWMEYTGVEWSNAQSNIKLPPYVLIWERRGYGLGYGPKIAMEPMMDGIDVNDKKAEYLVNSLVAKHPYRVIKCENTSFDSCSNLLFSILLQKCPLM